MDVPDVDTDAESAAAERWCAADQRMRFLRGLATHAAGLHDWPAFFLAAAECARQMNARAAVVEAALDAPPTAAGKEVPQLAAA